MHKDRKGDDYGIYQVGEQYNFHIDIMLHKFESITPEYITETLLKGFTVMLVKISIQLTMVFLLDTGLRQYDDSKYFEAYPEVSKQRHVIIENNL